MKIRKGQEAGITGPILSDLVELNKAQTKSNLDKVTEIVGSQPLAQPDLYQDSGSGYNANFVFPQD